MFFSPISHSVSAIFRIADSTPLVFLFSQFLQMTYKPYVSTLVMHYGLIYKNSFVWAAPCKNMSSCICGQERPKVILRIRTVWSRSSLSAKKKTKQKKNHLILYNVWNGSKDPDDTLLMYLHDWSLRILCLFEGTIFAWRDLYTIQLSCCSFWIT